MKKEEKKDSIFQEVDEFLTKTTKEKSSIISALITAIATILVGLVDILPTLANVEIHESKMLLWLAVIAVIVFFGLLSVQLYLIKKKRNEKTERLKSDLIDKYLTAIDQSFVNPKNA